MDNEQLLQVIMSAIDERFNSQDTKLDNMQNNISSLKDDVTSLKDDMTSVKSDVSSLKDDVTSLKDDVRAIKMFQENELEKRLSLLAEGHQMLYNKLSRVDDLANDIEEIKGAIVAVELRVDGRI